MNNLNEEAVLNEFKNSPMGKALQIIFAETLVTELKKYGLEREKKTTVPGFYEIKDICAMFKITPQTLHNWKNRGWISGTRMGKSRFFTKEEVEQAMANFNVTKGKF